MWMAIYGFVMVAIIYVLIGCLTYLMASEGATPRGLREEIGKPGGAFWTAIIWPGIVIIMMVYGLTIFGKFAWTQVSSYKVPNSQTNPVKMLGSLFRRA